MRRLAARVVAMIRIDAVWLATEPMDMRAGVDTALARGVKVFGVLGLKLGVVRVSQDDEFRAASAPESAHEV